MRYDRRETNAKETPVTRPVVAFQIVGKNPAALREFYSEIFGWEMDTGPMGIITVSPGVGGPGDIGGTIFPGAEARVVIFVQVLSLVDTLTKAEALGGRRVMEPFDVPGGPTVAQMADPEGNVIGLVKQ